jgi:hypothetical protein
MEYFFIAGNVASLAALVGFLLQMSHRISDRDLTRWTLLGGVALTIVFWIYFYFRPANRVKKTIQNRLNFAGLYIDSSNAAVEVFEGEFTLSDFTVRSIAIPPFETQPTVTLYPVGPVKSNSPSIGKITLDSFEVGAMTSSQWCTWRFRARGRQLLPRK